MTEGQTYVGRRSASRSFYHCAAVCACWMIIIMIRLVLRVKEMISPLIVIVNFQDLTTDIAYTDILIY
jgi:hypothetical protein